MKNRAQLFETLFIASIAVLHLSTLYAPFVGSDEVAFADYALHHDIHLFQGLVPPNFAALEWGYGFGMMPWYMAMLRFVLRFCGVSVPSVRILATLSGLTAVYLLYRLMQRTRSGPWAIGGLLIFVTSTPFFLSVHSARAEAVIFLMNVINIGWWMAWRGRRSGLLIGLLTGLAFGVYPSAVYIVVALAALACLEWRTVVANPDSSILWCLGVAVGIVVSVPFIDVEQAARFFSAQRYLFHSEWVRPPAILAYPWNPFRALHNGLFSLLQGSAPGSRFYPGWIAWLMSTLFVGLRRFGILSLNERRILVIALSTWAAHSLLTVSPQSPAYALYLFPWWIWQAALVTRGTTENRFALDRVDALLLVASAFLVISFSSSWVHETLLASLFVLCAVRPLARRAGTMENLFAKRFFQLGLVATLFILCTDQARIPFRLAQLARQNAVIQKEAYALRGEKKIIGPMTLWLYEPSLNLRCIDFEYLGLKWDPTAWIIDYRPSLILWPYYSLDALRALLARRHPALTYVSVGQWLLPVAYTTHFVGLRLIERQPAKAPAAASDPMQNGPAP